MSDDTALRQEIKRPLDSARARISGYTGLYADEDLTGDVLRICDDIAAPVTPDSRLEQARAVIEERCRRLAQAADRFADRDLGVIAAARAQAVAAVDVWQDLILELRKAKAQARRSGYVLRRRSR